LFSPRVSDVSLKAANWMVSLRLCELVLQTQKAQFDSLVEEQFDVVVIDDLYNPCGLLHVALQVGHLRAHTPTLCCMIIEKPVRLLVNDTHAHRNRLVESQSVAAELCAGAWDWVRAPAHTCTYCAGIMMCSTSGNAVTTSCRT
jgi:hypothetical protein